MTIDWWTLGIQTVNVIVLIWLLRRFFWRPLAAMIEQRRTSAQHDLTEAEATRGQATAALAEIERTRAGFAKERDAILATAHDDAERARTARLDVAIKEAASLEAAAKVEIEKEKEAAHKAWTEQASRLAVDIAERLLTRLQGPTVRATFLDWLLAEIRALPEPARQAMATTGAALEIASATSLEPADQQRYRKLIGEAFGATPEIVFKADPALIAGLELHGPHLVMNNSWRADLTRIVADLAHDDRH